MPEKILSEGILTKVSRVMEVGGTETVNNYLREGWIIIETVKKRYDGDEELYYVIGQMKE